MSHAKTVSGPYRFLCAIALTVAAWAQSPVTFQYFYDDARQLTKVVDSSGNVVEYVYDAAGNIMQINRTTIAAGALVVFNFTTGSGAPGTLVTIHGQGFSTTPTSNTVTFNGVAATVVSATANTLLVIIPAGATSGPISVTVGASTSTSTTSFTVLPPTPGVTLPTVSITNPSNGQTLLQGQTITIALNVTAGTSPVIATDISVNGQFLITMVPSSYQRNFTVPYGVSSLTFAARVRDQAGNFAGATPVTVAVTADPLTTVQGTVVDSTNAPISGASVALKVNGLVGEFFSFGSTLTAFPDLSGLTPDVVKRVSAVDFRNPSNLFSADTFGVSLGNNFAARFRGNLRLDAPANLTFTLGADDGANLIVNGTTVVSLAGSGFQEVEGSIALAAGSFPIEVQYFNGAGDVQLQLSYKSVTATNGEKRIVPPEILSPTADFATGSSITGGAFSFSSVPSNLGTLRATANATLATAVLGQTAPTAPAPGATTNLGNATLRKVLAAQVSSTARVHCMVATTGAGYCWGDGPLGNGSFSGSNTPRLVSGGFTWAMISAGGGHSCGITTSGQAYCWGLNPEGRIGNGTTTDFSSPTLVSGGLTWAWISAAGNNHSCGLTTGGQAYCWGNNFFGKLGDGTGSGRLVPTAVLGSLAFSTVTAGDFHSTCGLANGGNAYCWGLGLGAADSSVPVAVVGGKRFTQVTLGFDQGCGVTPSGEANCWGSNAGGQLGNGVTGGSSSTPVVVSGGLTFRQVDGGAKSSLFGGTQSHTCGVTTTGVGYCWGWNSLGQLGTGTGNVNVPTPVLGSLNFLLISAGEADACGVTRQGLVYCWGFGAGLNGTPQLQLEP